MNDIQPHVEMHGPYPDEAGELNKKTDNPYYEENEDDGTMPKGVQALREAVVGHRIVKAEKNVRLPKRSQRWSIFDESADVLLTLDTGRQVALVGVSDCCAFGSVDDFVQKLPTLDHIITDVGTTGVYTKWHILAGMEDVLELDVSWSPGNAFYYAYGIEIEVIDVTEMTVESEVTQKQKEITA